MAAIRRPTTSETARKKKPSHKNTGTFCLNRNPGHPSPCQTRSHGLNFGKGFATSSTKLLKESDALIPMGAFFIPQSAPCEV